MVLQNDGRRCPGGRGEGRVCCLPEVGEVRHALYCGRTRSVAGGTSRDFRRGRCGGGFRNVGGRKAALDAPAGWKEIPGGPFLVAKFTVGEEKSATVVNVSMSAGDGGGLLANVNRWRGQLGLSPWSEAEARQQAKELALANGTATLVEMSGTDGRTGQPATVVGAMLPRDGQTWFYKLMGDAQSVASQKSAFTHFVQEVKC